MPLVFSTPDDFHVHFRAGARLASVVGDTALQFARATVMPNLSPKHITTVKEVLAYRDEIIRAIPAGIDFTPLMTVSLAKEMTLEDLEQALQCEHVYAAKLYAGHTTNSNGVDDVQSLGWMFEALEKAGKPLLVHGEAGVTVDVFDREQRFYEQAMPWILETFKDLKVVCEHITTAYAAMFVSGARSGVAATITPQHLLVDRNDMLGKGGIRPDYYCMPILKTAKDREMLLRYATSGSPKFFLGTDSAPHPRSGLPGKSKYSSCGCAGCFTAPYALELYTEAFASVGQLSKLPDFASRFGREFYGLPPNKGKVVIKEVDPWTPAESFQFGDEDVVPFSHRAELRWVSARMTDDEWEAEEKANAFRFGM
jgi:dihydroorotase